MLLRSRFLLPSGAREFQIKVRQLQECNLTNAQCRPFWSDYSVMQITFHGLCAVMGTASRVRRAPSTPRAFGEGVAVVTTRPPRRVLYRRSVRKNRLKSSSFLPLRGLLGAWVLIVFSWATPLSAQEPAPAAAMEETPPMSEEARPATLSPCESWLQARIGEKDPTALDLEALLLAEDAAPPTPVCRLRAIFLAADQAPARAEALHTLGRSEALALLQLHEGWEELDEGDIEDHLPEATAKDAPALFWVGYFWGHLLKHMNPLSAGSQRGDVVAILERSIALSPDYYAGAADVWLGAYYASLPRFFGRDLDRSAAHFRRGLSHAGDHMGRQWTFSQSFLAGRDNEAFLRELNQIAGAKPEPGSPWYIENYIAWHDARAALRLK